MNVCQGKGNVTFKRAGVLNRSIVYTGLKGGLGKVSDGLICQFIIQVMFVVGYCCWLVMNSTKLGYQYNRNRLNTFDRFCFCLANFVLYSETLRIIYMSCFFCFVLFVCGCVVLVLWFKLYNLWLNYRKRSVLKLYGSEFNGLNSSKKTKARS